MNREIQQDYMDYCTGLLKAEIANGLPREKFGYLLFKLFSEVGEFVGEFCKKQFHNPDWPLEKFINEGGDCLWYIYNIIALTHETAQKEFFAYVECTYYQNMSTRLPMVNLSRVQQECGELLRFWHEDFVKESKSQPHPQMWVHLRWLIFDLVAAFKGIGIDYEKVMQANMEKLTDRHGSSYNPDHYTSSV